MLDSISTKKILFPLFSCLVKPQHFTCFNFSNYVKQIKLHLLRTNLSLIKLFGIDLWWGKHATIKYSNYQQGFINFRPTVVPKRHFINFHQISWFGVFIHHDIGTENRFQELPSNDSTFFRSIVLRVLWILQITSVLRRIVTKWTFAQKRKN